MTPASSDPHWFEHVDPGEAPADVATTGNAQDCAAKGGPTRGDGRPVRSSRARGPVPLSLDIEDMADALIREVESLGQLSFDAPDEDEEEWDDWIKGLPRFGAGPS